jgi:hypothetical protein
MMAKEGAERTKEKPRMYMARLDKTVKVFDLYPPLPREDAGGEPSSLPVPGESIDESPTDSGPRGATVEIVSHFPAESAMHDRPGTPTNRPRVIIVEIDDRCT